MSVVILATPIIPVSGAPITPQKWSSPTFQTGRKDYGPRTCRYTGVNPRQLVII